MRLFGCAEVEPYCSSHLTCSSIASTGDVELLSRDVWTRRFDNERHPPLFEAR
jgi:hypothetical protein